MKIKTSELTGLALDWALAVAMGLGPDIGRHCYARYVQYTDYKNNIVRALSHTDPATCMGLIKEHFVYPFCYPVGDADDVAWGAGPMDGDNDDRILNAGCPEIAVARCVVAMRLGDVVEIPDELRGVQP